MSYSKEKTPQHEFLSLLQEKQQTPQVSGTDAHRTLLLLPLFVRLVKLLQLPALVGLVVLLPVSAAVLRTGLPTAGRLAAGDNISTAKELWSPLHYMRRPVHNEDGTAVPAATTATAEAIAAPLGAVTVAPSASRASGCFHATAAHRDAATVGQPATIIRCTPSVTVPPRGRAARRAAAAPRAVAAAPVNAWGEVRARKHYLDEARKRHRVRSFAAADVTRHPSRATPGVFVAVAAASDRRLYKLLFLGHVHANDKAKYCSFFLSFPYMSNQLVWKTLFDANVKQILCRRRTSRFRCTSDAASTFVTGSFAGVTAHTGSSCAPAEANGFLLTGSAALRHQLPAISCCAGGAGANNRPHLFAPTSGAVVVTAAGAACRRVAASTALSEATRGTEAKAGTELFAAAHQVTAEANSKIAPVCPLQSSAGSAAEPAGGRGSTVTTADSPPAARGSRASADAATAAQAEGQPPPDAAAALRISAKLKPAAATAASTPRVPSPGAPTSERSKQNQRIAARAAGLSTREETAQEPCTVEGITLLRSQAATCVITPVAVDALRPIVKGRVSAERGVPSSLCVPFYALRNEAAAAAAREVQQQEEQQQRREEATLLRTRLARYLPVSTREIEWVKTSKEIQGIRHACDVAAAVLQKAVDFVRDAAELAAAGQLTTDAIDAVVHAAALHRGAYPSPLRYSSFPKSVCTSVNEVICHGIYRYMYPFNPPITGRQTLDAAERFCARSLLKVYKFERTSVGQGMSVTTCPARRVGAAGGMVGIPDDAPLQEGSICSIDVSCYVAGFHGDCARTVTIGRPGSTSASLLQLVAAAEEATLRAVAACGPGKKLSVVGDAIESFLSSRGYCTIPYFCGHGIGRSFHEEPFVIHVPNSMPGRMLPGMCFTIEPVVCSGGPEYKIWDDKWTVSSLDGAPSAQFEHTVLITETGVEILTPYPGSTSSR